jgi:hypothetical protein
MRSFEGQALRWEVENVATQTALLLAERVSATGSYLALLTLLPSERVATYFEKRIKDEIYPVIRTLCVTEWRLRNGKAPLEQAVVWDGHHGLGPSLLAVWPSEEIPLVLGAAWRLASAVRPFTRRGRWALRRLILRTNSLGLQRSPGALQDRKTGHSEPAAIAQHYAEGIDLTRRSDLFWFPQSHIDPHRIVVHFEHGYAFSPNPGSSPELDQLERWGMRWVELDKSRADSAAPPILNRALPASPLVAKFRHSLRSTKSRDTPDSWTRWASEFLLQEVEDWRSFYEMYNIKVHFEPEEGRHLPQSLALDLVEGIRLGKQRSENLGWEGSCVGYHPNHVFFTWSRRGIEDLLRSRNRIDYVIVAGFPNDAAFRQNIKASHAIREQLGARGAGFVVALFDEVFGPDVHFSRSMMQDLYTQFLQWVIDDPEVGLVIKSKKPVLLEHMPEVHGLLEKAEATGRCVRLTNVFGRLPSDASQAADISVGIGISSAVTEAVIAGGRGVHCDLTGMRSHPFYQWGYEKVVFDDLDRLMAVLKRCKEHPGSEPGLGNFSSVVDELDPFRDGRAGERVGNYIRWLLEAFDEGHDRNTAIQQANERYARTWGADKVISLKPGGTERTKVGPLNAQVHPRRAEHG